MPRATTRVLRVAGSYAITRPVLACSRMSSTLASNVPPQSLGAKRVEASLRYILPFWATTTASA